MWSAVQGACTSRALCTSVIRSFAKHLIPLHFLCTQCLQPFQKIPFLPTPVRQTAHETRLRPVPQIMIFVFPELTQSFLLHCFFPNQEPPDTFLERFSDDNKIISIKVLSWDPRAELVWQGLKHYDEEQQAQYRVMVNTNIHFKLFTVPLNKTDGSAHRHTSPAPVAQSTPSFLSAHLMTFRGTPSKVFSRSTKAM